MSGNASGDARESARERSRLSERSRVPGAESSGSLDGMSEVSGRLERNEMRPSSGLGRERGSASGSAEGAGENVLKRKREVSGEQQDGDEAGNERMADTQSPPHKRLQQAQTQTQESEPSDENTQEDPTRPDATPIQGERDACNDQGEDEGKLQITIDSTGIAQVSIGSGPDNQGQFAFINETAPLSRPSSDHASDHDFSNTPIPSTVREEIISAAASGSTSRPRKKPFSLLIALCRNNDLLLHFVSYLPIPSLISLYAISKTFHFLFNRHHTAFIMSSMRTWAPNADTIYPWRCYKSLCTNDPQLRQKMKYRGLDEEEAIFRLGRRGRDLRDVPTLRWLQMVTWRQGVCKDIMVMLATKGLRCPPGTLDAVKVSCPNLTPSDNMLTHYHSECGSSWISPSTPSASLSCTAPLTSATTLSS